MNDNPSGWSSETTLAAYAQALQTTYGRWPLVFVRGQGLWLWDAEGRKYLDWVSGGRAGNALGHCHPHVTAALQRQAETLTYVSNDFHNPWAARLGQMLSERTGGRKVFFCNSGAEATEAALKLARKWGKQRRGDACHEVITFTGSFHGRTFGAISATAQPKYQDPFRPIVPGFRYLPWGDLAAVERAAGETTCAVMLEPVQGESGIHPAPAEFLRGIERICREREILLVMDEVQTGFGRSGRFWAYEHFGVEPDVVTLAKAVGGGTALGCLLAREECAVLAPGDHGCTFGGYPLATAAGIAALEALDQEGGIANAARLGELLLGRFRQWQARWPQIRDVRGLGLLLAIEFAGPEGKAVLDAAMSDGLLIHPVGDTVLRILPAVVMTESEAEQGLQILEGALRKVLGD